MGRLGTAKDMATGVPFLVSDESSCVTGSELMIDGSMHRTLPVSVAIIQHRTRPRTRRIVARLISWIKAVYGRLHAGCRRDWLCFASTSIYGGTRRRTKHGRCKTRPEPSAVAD